MELQIKNNQPELLTSSKTNWKVWWNLLRPHTLTASFVPVAIGTALALPISSFHLFLFLAMLFASMLIQIATNMFNEYFDYKNGLDTEASIGIGGTIVRDGIAPATILTLSQYTLTGAFLLGIYICQQSSWWLLPIGLCCGAVGYFYSGGPYPISSTPLGEVISGACMGVIIIGISFFLQTGTVTSECVLISIPTSILIGAILMANNIRDLDGDKQHGRKTLAILLGRKTATTCLMLMFALSYLWILMLICTGVTGMWSLLTLVSLPKAFAAINGFRRNTIPEALMPAMVATAQTNTLVGLALSLSLLLEHLFS